MPPTVSVLIPTFARPHDLAACLHAIAAQRGPLALQVCVVNDGGPSVRAIAESFHPALDVQYVDAPAGGQVEARNRALQMAEGEYIALCDDDDRWLPHHVRDLLAALAANAGARFAFCDAELVWMEGDPGRRLPVRRRPFAWREHRQLLPCWNPIAPSSVLYTRDLQHQLGPFDVTMSHYWDWDFWLRVNAETALTRVPACHMLYAIAVDESSQSADPARMRQALYWLMEKHALGDLPSSNFGRMLDEPALAPFRDATVTPWSGDQRIWNPA